MMYWEKQYLKFVGLAALNTAIFVTVRVKMYNKKNKLYSLNSKEFYDTHQFSRVNNLHISNDLLKEINVSISDDVSGTYEWFGYKYKDVYFLFKKYNNQKYWSLFVDLKMCETAKEDFNELYQEFFLKEELKGFEILWENKKLLNKN